MAVQAQLGKATLVDILHIQAEVVVEVVLEPQAEIVQARVASVASGCILRHSTAGGPMLQTA
jgi:hypothetical protein